MASPVALSNTIQGPYSTIRFEQNKEWGLVVLMKNRFLEVRTVIAEDRPFYEQLINKNVVGLKKKAQFDRWLHQWKIGSPFSGLTVLIKETLDYLGYLSLEATEHTGTAEFKYRFYSVDQDDYQRYCVLAVKMVLEEYVFAIRQMGYLVQGSPFNEVIAKVYYKDQLAISMFSSLPKMEYIGVQKKLVYGLKLEGKEKKCCRWCVIL